MLSLAASHSTCCVAQFVRYSSYANGSPMHPGSVDQAAKVPTSFFQRDAIIVARDLIGKLLVHRDGEVERVGEIVETEAYLGTHDAASHSARGLTKRNACMFGPVGRAYVYLVYGLHHCMNVVTGSEGTGAAVLIRALRPINNCDGKTTGPGLLCKSMRIDLKCNGHDLQSSDLFIASPEARRTIAIVAARRIGVDYAGRWSKRLLRYYERGNPFISRK
jgi:DNA-3-methyladenine glycosylase